MGKKGFTLIELVFVVLFLGVLAVLARPLVNMGRWPLETAARKLASDMREARAAAIGCGQTCTLTFYEFGGRYRLDLPSGSSYSTLPEGICFAANNFPLDGESRRPTLYFRYTGAPNRGGHVALRDKAGRKRYIIVTPVTVGLGISEKPP